jgi:hypothetical protein
VRERAKPYDEPNRRFKFAHATLWLVFMIVLRGTFCDAYRPQFIDDIVRQLGNMECLLHLSAQSRVFSSREQHEIVAAMVRDDDGFALRYRSVSPEFPLQLPGGDSGHGLLPD